MNAHEPRLTRRDIKSFLIARIQRLANLDATELRLQIDDIVDDLASNLVKVTLASPTEKLSPVPPYDPAHDGDYSAFLARHNVD